MMIRIKHYVYFLCLLVIAGCEKNERPIEEWSFTSLQLKAITVDPLMLSITANGKLLTDSLFTPGDKAVSVQYFDPAQRFKITDLYSKEVLLDTMVQYKPGAVNAITFFQALAGGKLVRIGPPENEALPPAGAIKISINYANQELPAEVKVVVEDSETGNTTYTATDSFLLKKGTFSPYFIGKMINNRRPRLKFYTPDANRKLIARVEATAFSNTNTDFTIYSFNSLEATDLDGVFYLKRDKLY